MALAKRVVPCLDVQDGRVVKGVKFVNIRDAGDPAEVAARYDADGADELVLLDITASVEKRAALLATVRAVAERVRIPLTVGGGVRGADDVARLLRAGADKVSINTAAVARPEILRECAARFGAQCIVLAVDARRRGGGGGGGGWEVVTRGGRTATGMDAVAWVGRAEGLGAGEILLTSMDADGGGTGYDVALLRAVGRACRLPLIASGGAGTPAHLAAALVEGGADAALAASIFHDGVYAVAEVKRFLQEAGVRVRWAVEG